MKSEKIVKVIIKDERMRDIRKNLRDLLKCAVEERLKQLLEEAEAYYQQGNERKENLKIKEHSDLISAFRRSTIECSYRYIEGSDFYACVSLQKAIEQGEDVEKVKTNLDLVWIPIYKNWFCTECVKEFDMESLTLEDFPDLIAQMESEFRK
jgi:hypothetical protein